MGGGVLFPGQGAGLIHAFVLFVDVVVEVGGLEVGLVSEVHVLVGAS